MSRVLSLADFMKKVKGASSKWMHSQGRPYDEFAWQAGYGVFSIGASQLGALIAYVDSQEEHHRKKTFQEEFREMLERYGVDYDERYLWD